MSSEDFSNVHAFIYHLSKMSKSWILNNPYSIALRSILLNQTSNDFNLRPQQEYHYLAKMIFNELNENKSEIKSNVNDLNFMLENYKTDRSQSNGDIIIKRIFISTILHFLNKSIHFNILDKRRIIEFLSYYSVSDSTLKKENKILCLINSVESNDIDETLQNDLDLALVLLHDRLLIYNTATRSEEKILDYYIKQNRIEKIDVENVTSELSMLNLLEIAVILKAATGKGLYIPELEKEQYLSNITKEFVVEKYLGILNDVLSYKIHKIRLPLWSGYILFFMIESIFLFAPVILDSIQIGPMTIKLSFLTKIPVWALLFGNGVGVALYNIYSKKKLENRIRALRWK